MSLEVRLSCSETPGRLQALKELCRDLIEILGAESVRDLSTLIVVPNGEVAQTINDIIHDLGDTGCYVPCDSNPATAVTVPLERDGSLTVMIILSQGLLAPLAKEWRFHPEVVSTLLEELLHAWIYGSAWRRRGYVQCRQTGALACDLDLRTLASMMCDEYVVIRRKAVILATTSLVQQGPGEATRTATLQYGDSAARLIDRYSQAMKNAIQMATTRTDQVAESWSTVLSLLYRGVLEPLSRSTAYDDAYGRPTYDVQQCANDLYRATVRSRWPRMRENLRRVYESDLQNTEAAVDSIAGELRAMLAELGVAYSGISGGACAIRFVLP